MDAFSLALSLGTLSFSSKKNFILAGSVGIFHFFMPIIGTFLGAFFVSKLHVEAHLLSGVIFMYIAIEMFKDFKSGKSEEVHMSIIGVLLFALGVSLDSFGVGFATIMKGVDLIKTPLVFTIVSFSFTLAGLMAGKKLNSLVGEYSILLGALMMCVLALINFCQFLF